jgi:hypothetical protein
MIPFSSLINLFRRTGVVINSEHLTKDIDGFDDIKTFWESASGVEQDFTTTWSPH